MPPHQRSQQVCVSQAYYITQSTWETLRPVHGETLPHLKAIEMIRFWVMQAVKFNLSLNLDQFS